MTDSRRPARSSNEPSTPYDALGNLVHERGPVTIHTTRGSIVCMDQQTYLQLTELTTQPTRQDATVDTRRNAERVPITVPGDLNDTAEAVSRDDTFHPVVKLTSRELELLRAVAAGYNAATIADQRGLATNTVVQHLVSVRRKFRVATTAGAVLAARAEGQL